MQTTTLFGFELLFVALVALIGMVYWSRHIIETIHRRRLKSLREIQQELRNGR